MTTQQPPEPPPPAPARSLEPAGGVPDAEVADARRRLAAPASHRAPIPGVPDDVLGGGRISMQLHKAAPLKGAWELLGLQVLRVLQSAARASLSRWRTSRAWSRRRSAPRSGRSTRATGGTTVPRGNPGTTSGDAPPDPVRPGSPSTRGDPPRPRRPPKGDRRHAPSQTAPATPEPPDTRLVPVEVDSLRVGGDPPTAETSACTWRGRLPAAGGKRPDLTPVAEQLRALFAATGRLVPKPGRLLVLKETGGERFLPIVVGVAEAEALKLHLQGHPVPRPLGHDLMRALVEASGLPLELAAVTGWEREKDLFYATLTLRGPRGRAVEVDAGPSDALNLALRAGAPLFATEAVLAQAGVTPRDRDEGQPPADGPAAAR